MPNVDSLLNRFLLHPLLPFQESLGNRGGGSVFDGILETLSIRTECAAADIARIPAHGSVIVVANHPFGLAEGAILGSLLSGVRPDVKILANSLLRAIPQLAEHLILVDPFGSNRVKMGNSCALRQSVEWLRAGGLLVVFPAGEVSSLQLPRWGITDPVWNAAVARMAQLAKASVVPVFFPGSNSPAFHAAGLVHARLRTALLSRELLRQRNQIIRLRIGAAVPHGFLTRLSDATEATSYLRTRTYLLGERTGAKKSRTAWLPSRREVVVPEVNPELLEAEVAALPAAQCLLANEDYGVYLGHAAQMPHTMREIGRLREISFRLAGEGTGECLDVDRFDAHYWQLILWHKRDRCIAGGYRFAPVLETVSAHGQAGLYTATLFRFAPEFFARIGPALELGRSFIAPAFQKSYQPLLLLWKGILRFVALNPQYRRLFGAVSISGDYSPISRSLMASFLQTHHGNPDLSLAVQPRRRFRAALRGRQLGSVVGRCVEDLDELSKVVSDLEGDRKPVPVLIRQYLNMGGQAISFNVDRGFSNALDALIVVDLEKTKPHLLARYMGAEPAAGFLARRDSLQ